MFKYFDTDHRKLSFEVHESNVSVISISKAKEGLNREILIPKNTFLELIEFIEINCKCLDLYPFYETITFGTSIEVRSSLDFSNYKGIAEQKIYITFKEPCSDDKEAIGFKFNFKRILEFKKFLLQFKSLQVKSHKIPCEESVKMKNSNMYKYKSLNIKAEPYKIGMEDGVDISMRSRLDGHIERFIVRDTLKENGATVQDNVERLYANNKAYDVEEYKPFLDYCDNKHYIDKTDMIVTDALGDRFPMSLKVFKATFEEAVDCDKC